MTPDSPSPREGMISGSIPALVTPMSADHSVDFEAFGRLLDWHLECGSSAVVVAGTTGESASLEADEFERLLALAVARLGGRLPVIAGTGTAGTRKTIRQTRKAARLGADAALVVTPYYNRPTQAGMQAHFEAVAEEGDLPVILYNVPGRTGVDLQPDTVSALAGHPRIIGLKEANAAPERMPELVRRVGALITLLSGDDPSACQSLTEGAVGVISVAANVVPARFAELCRLACGDADDQTRARALDRELAPLYDALALETNPQPVKWALHRMGRLGADLRLPLLPLGEASRGALELVLRQMNLME